MPTKDMMPVDMMPVVAPFRIDSRRKWFPDLREAVRARQLVFLFFKRDITVMYRQTVLGAVWIVLAPLLSAGLFSFVFGSVANLSAGGVPYFAFSYAGLLAWNLFSGILSTGSNSLTSTASLFTRIYFPRLILPFSRMAPALVNAGISCVVMAVILVAYRIPVAPRLVTLPLWLLLAVLLATGCSLILASTAVFYRDVQYISTALVPMLLLVTPVAYSVNAVPKDLQTLYLLNPVASIVEGCRWSLIGHTQLTPWAVAYSVAATVAVFAAGLVVFARLEWKIADVV
jgi:lipopolysaccharide transport system permease protein